MTNVLPQETRARIERLVSVKFLIIAALILIVCGVIALLSILPAYVSIYLPKQALIETSRELREAEAQASDDRTTVARTRALLAELAAVKPEPTISPLIDDVLAMMPAGIDVDNISYRPGTLILAGKAPDRRDIESFRERLSASGRFANVTVPVAALVGALSGSFTITLTGSF